MILTSHLLEKRDLNYQSFPVKICLMTMMSTNMFPTTLDSPYLISDPEKLINRTRNVSIAKCRDGPFNRFISGNFRDYTKDSYLINNKRFNLSTCSVTNLILRHEFNELEICSSQISLWFVTSLTLLSFIIDIFTFYPPHVTSSTYTLSTPYSLQIGFLFY